jgi:hypothetical protein
VPLLEDVIEVSPTQLAALTSLRAHVQFATEKRVLREWLRRESKAGRRPLTTSIESLAEAVSLSPAAVRSALALLISDGVVDSTPARRASAGERGLRIRRGSRPRVRSPR